MAGPLERITRLITAVILVAAITIAVPPSTAASGVPPVGVDDEYVVVMNDSLTSDPTWHLPGWAVRRQLTFSNSTRAPLVDVPILVSLDATRIDYGRTQSQGQDLRFIDSDGTPLDHEIEEWDETGSSSVWVRVPQIDASDTDHIFVYYGNDGAGDAQNAGGVWTNGYVGVWHLSDDPTGGAGSIGDSTSYGNDGDSYNLDASNMQPGRIGGGLSFAGLTAPNADHIRIPSDGVDELSITGTALTLEAWVNRTGDTSDWQIPIGRQFGTGSTDSFVLAAKFDQPTRMLMAANDSVTSPLPANAIPLNDWRYLTGVRDGASLFAYSNGAEVASATGLISSIVTDANDITIGGAENDGTLTIDETWLGLLDEIRVSDVARSADWIDAQHASMTDALTSFGPETVPGVLVNDSDPELDSLTAVIDTPPSNALSFGLLADGSFNYTPTAGFTGIDSFTYTANDGTGSSLTTNVTITVYDERFVVNSTGDSGDSALGDGLCDTGGVVDGAPECTLRAAIQQGNNSTGLDLVDFAIPTTDAGYSASPLVYTLTPASPFDYIDWPLVLDASTQPGFVNRPIIQLDGSSAGAATAALALRTNDSSIIGFIAHTWLNDDGLEIDGSTGNGDNNTISGNWVGVDADETAGAIGDFGILVTHGAVGNTIHGNVVGSSATGLGLRVTATAGNVVTANLFGIGPDGVTPMPNTLHGVFIEDTATGNTIGGSSPADTNRIRFNGGDGVHIAANAGNDNSILGNEIYSNTGLGIDRAGGTEDVFEVTANGSGGPNDGLNHPVPTAASETAGTVTVDFDLDAPAGDYRIEVFTNPSGADPSGHGEGESFEAGTTISHTGAGSESFQIAYTGSIGDTIALTATEESAGPVYGSTSEFSATFTVTVGCSLGDSDADGLCDLEEDANSDADNDPATNPGPDTDGDLSPNYLDADDDDDGTPTSGENPDPNADGDPRDALDADRDGEPDYLDAPTGATDGSVANEQKISDLVGGFGAALDDFDGFGRSVAPVGDIDNDGINDLVAGTWNDDDGGPSRGAAYILFMNANGTVRTEQKISSGSGGLVGPLSDDDWFGSGVAGTGDIDGDGINDVAIGALNDDDGGANAGAVYIFFLNADGTARAEQKISATSGGLAGPLDAQDRFGASVAGIGDLNGDGVNDLAVGASGDADGGPGRGAVYILFMNPDGTVQAEQKISDSVGGFVTALDDVDGFAAVASIGDVDSDGVNDLAVGATGDDDGGMDRGAVYILLLNDDGTVRTEQKISHLAGGLAPVLDNMDRFGSVGGAGDLDNDGIIDLVVGATGDDDGGSGRGAVYLLHLDAGGSVTSQQKISATQGSLTGPLADSDQFGTSVAGIGDLDGDGTIDLAVGAFGDDDGGSGRGAVYVLRLSNLPPTADAGGPYAIDEGDPLPLDGSASSDPETDPLSYAWDLDNDTFYDDAITATPSVPWATLAGLGLNDDGGPFTIGLQVDDGMGNTDTGTTTLTIANAAPEITVDGPDSIEAYQPYVVALTVTDPGDDTVTEWTINWGDGTIDTIAGNPTSASHIYTRPGLTFPIIASVVDDDGTWHDNRMVVPGLFSGQQLFRLEATTGAVFDNIGTGTGIGGAITAIIGPDDLLYVGSYTTHDIRRYNPVTGAYLGIWVAAGAGGLNGPAGMMFGPDGDLYVSSNFGDSILRVDATDPTNVTTFVPTNSGGLDEPDDMIFGPDGDLYVTSFNTNEVLRYDGTTGAPKGAFVTAGSGGLSAPSELVFGPDDNLYVTSVANDRVIEYNGVTGVPTGVIATDPQLDQPRGAIFGPDGDLYVGGRTNIIRFDGDTLGSPSIYVPNGVIDGPSQSVFVPSEQADVLPCADTDADGLCDVLEDADTDADNDPSTNPGPNTDGDLSPNYLDADDDEDGTPTASENADPNADGDQRDALDADRDSEPDYLDLPTTASPGTVATAQKISETQGGLVATLTTNDHFGRSVASIGDLDGDGIADLAVGAHWDNDGGADRGAVYVLFMNADGTVRAEQKISDLSGGFTAVLDNSDEFGIGVAGLGDLDGDLIPDIAVGSHQDDDGVNGNGGAVYVLFLNANGTVKSHQKISETDGGLGVLFAANDRFGSSVANLGDVNGDGLNDLAVGAKDDDDGGANKGAVYVLFLDEDGTVKGQQKISEGTGGLTATLAPSGGFGIGVAGLGDLDGNGTNDIAVGNYWDDDGGTNHGAVHVLFLNPNGTVSGEQKISDTAGGFTAALAGNDEFGTAVGGVGDVDADGVPDLIVGAPKDDDGNSLSGSAYLLFLNSNGTVKGHQKISNADGSLGVTLNTSDQFGFAVAGIGDLDGDGTIGLAVGVYGDDDGGPADRGAVYVLNLDTACADPDGDGLCSSFETLYGDTDGDTTPNENDADDDNDLTPTASENADPNSDGDPRDALDSDWDGEPDWLDAPITGVGTVVGATQKISATAGGLAAALDSLDMFGASTTSIGDLDRDGVIDVAVGAPSDDDGGTDRGAVHVLFMNTDGTVKSEQKISATQGGLTAVLDDGDDFGTSISGIGDIDGDGVPDLAVGAPSDDDGSPEVGAVHILFMNTDGTVKGEQKISATQGGIVGPLFSGDDFGSAVSGVGDLNDDGINDIAVGALNDLDGGGPRGAVYILFLATDGTVSAEQKISETQGGLVATIDIGDAFGGAVAGIGDIDNDGVEDIAIGAWGDGDGGPLRGAVHVLRLNTDGTIKAEQKISSTVGGLAATVDDFDIFGQSVAGIGDVDGDNVPDLAVGSIGTDQWGSDSGAVHLLLLNNDGTVKAEQSLENARGGLPQNFVAFDDTLGTSVTSLGDLDGDGDVDLMVGAGGDDDGGTDVGAVYTLFLTAPSDISGTVFEDLAGDVLSDGSIGDVNNPGAVGVDIQLFNGSDELIQTATTDGSGGFTFADLADDTYTIAVDSRTVPSAQDPTALQGDIWATQTYGPTGAQCADGAGGFGARVGPGPCYGGQITGLSDGESGWENHVAVVTIAGADLTGLDFGFSFNVVVNDRGDDNEDDDATSNRTVQGSLRQFIQNANAISGSNAMRFVPVVPTNASQVADQWWSLNVTDPLPPLSAAGTTIDGTAYDLTDGTTVVDPNSLGPELELDGTGIAATTDGLTITGGTAIVRDLVVNRFTRDGIRITTAGSNTIAGNYVGTNAVGTAGAGNGNDGIRIISAGANQIGGTAAADRNTISGNGNNGLLMDGLPSTGNTVEGNYVGLNAAGDAAIPNTDDGVDLSDAPGNTIGGTAPGAGNVISGQGDVGLLLVGSGTTGNLVQGNRIGTNALGTAPVPNLTGVGVSGGASGNTIGGATAAHGNLISENTVYGIDISGTGSDSNVISANLIGTGVAGTGDLGNGNDGIAIRSGAQNNVVGGITVGERNVISGNDNDGVWITGVGTDGNSVTGNWIGFGSDSSPIPNLYHGVAMENGAADNIVGGDIPAEANRIGHSGWDGVTVGGGGTGNSVLGNSIVDNTGIGIDLVGGTEDGFGVTTNGTGTTDHPTPTAAVEGGGTVTVDFDLDAPAGDYRIEAFTNASGLDPSGYGEGETFETATTITHTGSGSESFQIAYSGAVGDQVTLTATSESAGPVYGATSEFSPGITAIVGTGGGTISGSVLEDVDGDGDVLDDGTGVAGVQVWLFADQGNGEPDAGDPVAATAVTDGLGAWSAPVVADGTYWVAVDSTDIEPATGYNVTFSRDDVWAEQTYGSAGAVTFDGSTFSYAPAAGPLYGGKQPDVGDGFPSLSRAEHVHRVVVSGADVTGVDSGFSFQVITNTGDELDSGAFDAATAWDAYDPGANGVGVDPDGYRGIADDGRYLYFAPYGDGVTYHGEVLRYDTTGAFSSPGSWSAFDPGANGVGVTPDGYAGALFDGRYVYFSPYGSRHGEVLRYDTQATFAAAGSWSAFDPGTNGVGTDPDGYLGLTWDGRYVYFSPYNNGTASHGEVLRYDTTATFAVAGSWTTFDPGANGVGTDPDGFVDAGFDGRYAYFVPYDNGAGRHGEVLRFDTQATFSAAGSWSAFDPGANGVGTDPDGFSGVVFDGQFLYFVPNDNGTSRHGEVLRYDTTATFAAAGSWSTFDAGANGVGTDPDGFRGGTYDGRYVYFVPYDNGTARHGEVLRYDTAGAFGAAGSWSTFDAGANGVGTDPDGYGRAVFDGRHIYFSPIHNGTAAHGEVLRYDTSRTGQGTLRQFIDNSEAAAGTQSSQFAIPTTDPGHTASPLAYTIRPVADLPTVSDTAVVDGTTQPDFPGTPIIELDGSLAGGGSSGVTLTSTGSTIRGLVVNRFTTGVALLGGANNVVVGNYLGPDVTGLVGQVGNIDEGLMVMGATGTVIGGSVPADRNVISGNRLRGVIIDDFSDGAPAISDNTRVIANYIGTNASGSAPLPYNGAGDTQQIGLYLLDGPNNDLGGPGAEGNVISGNDWYGIYVFGANATGNTIQGNIIGLDESATFAVGNGADDPVSRSGVTLSNAPGNLIGGTGAGEANTIAGNDAKGLILSGAGSIDNGIVANLIHSNAGIGIDLVGGAENGAGVTANDPGDSGPNDLLDYPVITSATASGATLTVNGTFDAPAGDYRFEFFLNPSGADPSGYGEGEVLAGAATLSHGGTGPEPFGAAFPGSVGDVVSAVITEVSVGPVYGSTSEFSAWVVATGSGGSAEDSSVRRSDVAGQGGVDLDTPATGLIANGFDLGGGTERLVGPATDILSGQLTLSAWARLDTAGTDPRVVAKAASDGSAVYELLVDDATGQAVARLDIGGATTEVRGGSVPTGSWHQLAVTWDGSIVRLYVDGSQVDSAGAVGSLATDLSVPLNVGNLASADRGLDGRIDQITVTHDARSASRIATEYANVTNPTAFVSMGAAQTAAPGAWTVSTSVGRTGSNSLAAPEVGVGADAWATAIGIDEPGVEFRTWWLVSDPALVTVTAGSRTGLSPTDQNETALSAAGFDLATIVGPTRSQEATSPTSIGAATWTEVTLRTDEFGVSTVWVDGVQILGPTLHSGGATTGSVGLRAGEVPTGETWYVDDARLRRYVSDEPVTTLGPLDRN